jgi:predicted RNA-binding protein YlqC (UPF0109 family)
MSDPEPGNEADDYVEDDDVDGNVADEGNRRAGGTALAVLDFAARQIVDDPDAIDIEVDERRGEVTLRLHAAPDDLGRLIGRRGRVAQALRAVTRAAGSRDGVHVRLDIED